MPEGYIREREELSSLRSQPVLRSSTTAEGGLEYWNDGFKCIEHGARSKELREKNNTMLHAPCSLLLAHNIPHVWQKHQAPINILNFKKLCNFRLLICATTVDMGQGCRIFKGGDH